MLRWWRQRKMREKAEEEFPLPDPQLIAQAWPKLDPETQHVILKAYGLCDCTECQEYKASVVKVREGILRHLGTDDN